MDLKISSLSIGLLLNTRIDMGCVSLKKADIFITYAVSLHLSVFRPKMADASICFNFLFYW